MNVVDSQESATGGVGKAPATSARTPLEHVRSADDVLTSRKKPHMMRPALTFYSGPA